MNDRMRVNDKMRERERVHVHVGESTCMFPIYFLDTGNKTTWYATKQDNELKDVFNGDHNPPPTSNEPLEDQYLVKWCKWSHIHNTWETEATLLAQNVKGMKKFYNFLKREGEREEWERGANPEDIEYAKCQEELGEQLLETVTQVERVIGEEFKYYTVYST